jgi:hypothetical protein
VSSRPKSAALPVRPVVMGLVVVVMKLQTNNTLGFGTLATLRLESPLRAGRTGQGGWPLHIMDHMVVVGACGLGSGPANQPEAALGRRL